MIVAPPRQTPLLVRSGRDAAAPARRSAIGNRRLHGDPRGRPVPLARRARRGRARWPTRSGGSATRSASSSSSATACRPSSGRATSSCCEAFFALPEDVKARIDKGRSPHFRGWERVGAELTDNRTDYREQLDVSTEHPPYPPDAEPPYLRLDGPNQWLPEDVLPGFRAAVDEFFARLGAVADELMEVLSVGLGLAPDHLRDVFGERPLSFAKLISYPPTPPGEAGVNAHHDAGFLTLLLQHGVGGLQVAQPRRRVDRRRRRATTRSSSTSARCCRR